jgi:hypothetical protein
MLFICESSSGWKSPAGVEYESNTGHKAKHQYPQQQILKNPASRSGRMSPKPEAVARSLNILFISLTIAENTHASV